MKRVGVSLMLLLLVFVLAGCRSNVGNLGEALDTWRNPNDRSTTHDTEIVNYEDGSFGPDLGFDVTYPGTTGLAPDRFYAINKWFGQIQYIVPPDKTYVLRVARENSTDLKTSYYETHVINITKMIDGIEVTTGEAEKGCTMSWWTKGDFQYILHSNNLQEPFTEEELETLVKGVDSKDVNKSDSSSP